jgi:hypothetical protein
MERTLEGDGSGLIRERLPGSAEPTRSQRPVDGDGRIADSTDFPAGSGSGHDEQMGFEIDPNGSAHNGAPDNRVPNGDTPTRADSVGSDVVESDSTDASLASRLRDAFR